MIKKVVFIFLGVVATVLLTVTSLLLVARMMSLPDSEKNEDVTDERPSDTVLQSAVPDERTNFLVMGKDETSGLYDVLMLVSYNMTKQSISVLQIPRDTYAEYTENNYRKINGAVNALGGERALCDFLSRALGVSIDSYISLDLDAVAEIVDVLGGVEVDIPFDMTYSDPWQGLTINLKQGKTLLDGNMARQFLRYRSGYAEGDLGRIDAQKIFLAALVNKLKSDVTLFDISSMAAAVIDDVKTSVSLVGVISLARQAFSVLPSDVRFVTMPGESAVAESSGASYYVISRPAAIRMVNELFGADVSEESFDENGVFLNERYDSFCGIYYTDVEYTVYDANSLVSGQVDILRK